MYLAEKTGRFMPRELHARFDVMQWLFWQVGGLGPMAGQLSHFVNYAPGGPSQHAYSHTRYANEYDRLFAVMERSLVRTRISRGRLFDRRYGVVAVGRAVQALRTVHGCVPERAPLVRRDQVPTCCTRGMDVGKDLRRPTGEMTEEQRKMMFGQTGASVLRGLSDDGR